MNELSRSVQHSIAQLRSRVDEVEDLRDASGLHEGPDNLSSRIGRFEENVNLNHVNDALRRIVRLEDCVGQVAARGCHTRMNHCEAGRQSLENRMRTQ